MRKANKFVAMEDKYLIYGRNAVLEALKSGNRINKVYIQDSAKPSGISEILNLVENQSVAMERVNRDTLDQICGKQRHQGVVASISPIPFVDLETVFQQAQKKGEPPFLLLLDELQDPQNVGALIRTADAAGVHGVLIPKRHACPLNSVVAKISAGAVEYVSVVQIGNISQTIEKLKMRGCWIVGADMDGANYSDVDLKGPVVLVIGGEGKGLGRLVKEHCDAVVSLPMHGNINSLNASVAGAILMYEIVRQRNE